MRIPGAPALARAGLALVVSVAACEWIASARAYRTTLPHAAWQALDGHLSDRSAGDGDGDGDGDGKPKNNDELVLLADPWLGPRGRQMVEALRDPRSIAPHDLYGVRRLTIISRGADDPWTPHLREAWGERPLPTADEVTQVGPFFLHRFDLPDADLVLFDLAQLARDQPRRLELRERLGRCRGARGKWTCKQGKIASEYAEVAYRPRRCLTFAVGDGVPITISLGDVELGDRLRGHLGFADFNARIRSDAPVLLEVAVDGRPHAALTISDRQGWAAFEIDTPPGRHRLEITLTPALSGTWSERGYDPHPTRTPCLELRALARPEGLP